MIQKASPILLTENTDTPTLFMEDTEAHTYPHRGYWSSHLACSQRTLKLTPTLFTEDTDRPILFTEDTDTPTLFREDTEAHTYPVHREYWSTHLPCSQWILKLTPTLLTDDTNTSTLFTENTNTPTLFTEDAEADTYLVHRGYWSSHLPCLQMIMTHLPCSQRIQKLTPTLFTENTNLRGYWYTYPDHRWYWHTYPVHRGYWSGGTGSWTGCHPSRYSVVLDCSVTLPLKTDRGATVQYKGGHILEKFESFKNQSEEMDIPAEWNSWAWAVQYFCSQRSRGRVSLAAVQNRRLKAN